MCDPGHMMRRVPLEWGAMGSIDRHFERPWEATLGSLRQAVGFESPVALRTICKEHLWFGNAS